MDREIATSTIRKRRFRSAALAVFAAATIVFCVAATLQWLRPSISRADLELARVELGAVDATLQASGTLIPAVEQVVSAPVEARVLRILRHAGEHVHAGDEVVELDTSATRLQFEQLRDRVAQKEHETAELRLKLDDSLAATRAQIEQKRLDGEILHFKAAQNAKLHEAGLVAEQENLAAATAAKKNELELAQLREALTRAERSRDAQLAAADVELQTARKQRDEAMRQLDVASMRAGSDGVLTSIVQDTGAIVRVGDVIARIADLSSYRVAATISDVHASRLAVGMPARIRIDDATTIGGRIATIDPRVDAGSVKFWLELDQPSHPKLRNNVRVDVFVVTGRRAQTLRVRRGALGQSAAEDVFVRRGETLVRVPVRWGMAGDEYLEAASGLRAGDEVVISNTSEYAGVDRIRVR